MRSILALSVFAFLTSAAGANSLNEAVRQAVETNPRVAAAQANYRATEYVLEQARGRLFPEIDISADAGKQRINRPQGLGPDVNDRWQYRRQVTVSIKQVLFDGWDRANDIYRSQARIAAASGRVLSRAEAVALSAVEAYVDVRRHRVLHGLASENVRRHRTLLQLINSRVEGGKSAISDKEQTLERLEAAKALASQIEVALGTANAKYKNVVGVQPSKLHPVKYAPGIPNTAAKVVDMALANNPRLQVLESEVDVADYDREQFRSSLYPQVYLEGSGTRGLDLEGTPGTNNELKASVVLRWRLFDGGVRQNRDLELAERASQKRLEQQVLARDITQEVEISWARLTSGQAEVNSLKKQADQNNRLVTAYRDEYEADKRSLLDVLDAESSKFASEFEYSNARALHVFSSYQLLAGMGMLLDTMGVAKPDGGDVPLEVESGLSAIKFDKGKLVIPPLR